MAGKDHESDGTGERRRCEEGTAMGNNLNGKPARGGKGGRRIGEGEAEEKKKKQNCQKEHPGRFYAVVVIISKYQKPPKLQRSILSGFKGFSC